MILKLNIIIVSFIFCYIVELKKEMLVLINIPGANIVLCYRVSLSVLFMCRRDRMLFCESVYFADNMSL